MKVYLSSLGCKLNESELEAWARDFAARGDEVVSDPNTADTIVVNTCTVTAQAAHKSRSLVRRLARGNQEAQIVVTGCYATLAMGQAAALPNVALVVPNTDKDELVRLAGARLAETAYALAENGCRLPEAASGALGGDARERAKGLRTRAFVKIEDGCNMSCSYCIIPLARGRARSRPQPEIVAEVRELVEAGFKEVILTGVQISDYRLEERESGRGRLRGLCDLVRALLNETDVPRLRLTSIAPWDLDEALLELFADPRLCRHLHLSLQSGSTTVLRRMRRPYTAEQYAAAVARARAQMADVGITTDVIVGFPGEAEVEFQESLALVEELKLARVHVFPYSAREGTSAARLPLQVSERVKEERRAAMQAVADRSIRRFAERFVGATREVLFEERAWDGVWSGYTDNYIRVVAESGENLGNRIVPTRLVAPTDDGARGTVWNEPVRA